LLEALAFSSRFLGPIFIVKFEFTYAGFIHLDMWCHTHTNGGQIPLKKSICPEMGVFKRNKGTI